MGTFDEMLASLHPNSEGAPQGANLEDERKNTPIVVTSKRMFQIPDGYDTVLAFAGDVNSQIVTFSLPLSHEGHDLTKCSYKILRWRHSQSGVEDENELQTVEITTDSMILSWIIPPAAFVLAGTLEIAISIYDLDENKEKVAFSWNTSSYNGFTIGTTLTNIPKRGQFDGYKAPASNEVLTIYEDGRSIVAPTDYNFVVANYGDENTSLVYFRAMQYIGGIDLLDKDNTSISVLVDLDGSQGEYFIDKSDIQSSYVEGSTGERQVEFIWRVSPDITNNSFEYIGIFNITIVFRNGNKVWKTSSFNQLTIGNAIDYDQNSLFPKQYYTIINGNEPPKNLSVYETYGLVKHRSHTGPLEETEEEIEQNEMIILFNEQNELVDIAIGSQDDEKLREAPTVRDIVRNHLSEEAPEFQLSDEDKEEIVEEVNSQLSTSIEELQAEVSSLRELVSTLSTPRYEIVNSIYEMTQSGVIYLLPKGDGSYYEEYLYIPETGTREPIGTTEIPLSEYASLEYLRTQPKLYRHNIIIREKDFNSDAGIMASLTIINNDPNSYGFDHNPSQVEVMSSENAWQCLRLYRALSNSTTLVKITPENDRLTNIISVSMNTLRRPCSGTVMEDNNYNRDIIDTIWAGYIDYTTTTTAILSAHRAIVITATQGYRSNNYPENTIDAVQIPILCGYTEVVPQDEANTAFMEKNVWSSKEEFIENEYSKVFSDGYDGVSQQGSYFFCRHRIYCKDYVETLHPYGI